MLVTLTGAGFEPPGPAERAAAIGNLDGLPEALQRAFAPDTDFDPLPVPGPHDWLSVHPEPGQTFEQFRRSKPNRPTPQRNVIYLQPLGRFTTGEAPPIGKLEEFAAAFFQMKVKLLPEIEVRSGQSTTRTNRLTHNRQVLTGDILDWLRARLPQDAFCILGVTMEDLYPSDSWNFVFGEASLRERVGVYSFARYDPAFYGQKRPSDYQVLRLQRSCKVLAHETAHMFGLAHCIYFHCLMNGSNHLQESDKRPLRLCPVCLRKLQWSIGFDVQKRYSDLAEFYTQARFESEAKWVTNRLEKLAAKPH